MDRISAFVPLLVVTVGLAVWTVIRAVVQPQRLTTYPVVAASMWLYFYAFMAIQVFENLGHLLPPWTLEFGQALALTALVAILLGEKLAHRSRGPVSVRPLVEHQLAAGRLWGIGLGLILVGGVANYLFVHQESIDWEGTTAYWYLLFHVVYPGLALVLVAKEHGAGRSPASRALVFAATTFAVFPHLVAARRGPVFPLVMVLAILPGLLSKAPPRRIVVLGSLAAAGFLMLTFVAARPWVYGETGGSYTFSRSGWSNALSALTPEDIVVGRTQRGSDNEFLYHCAMTGTSYELGLYQYGTGYLSLMTHWIPRSVWPEKPALGQGRFPGVVERIPLLTGWAMSSGAASGGVAETFAELGWGFIAVWLLLGWAMGCLHRTAKEGRDPRAAVAFVGVVCSSHWLISQGVAAAFVPTMIYLTVPAIAFRFARVRGTLNHPLICGRRSRGRHAGRGASR